ncbi:BadF/BadG/BcrA/BcrD ATPase family protein [Agromyces mediolanus]|uniref:N-acetylglucosamine kinase n=1 Tax=Agromyces mediolanus TaxID=41986 RepID=UPI003839559A
MSGLRVGLDVGGTKTALRAADASGAVVADVVVPSGEWDAEPVERAARLILDVVADALGGRPIAALAVGAQGLDAEAVARALETALAASGLPRVACVNDAALLVPAAGFTDGLGLIAGTGAIGVGRTADGRDFVTGGWGWVIGDEAGAAGLVREASRAALLAHDDGMPDDGLLGALLDAFGVADAERLARAVNDEPTMANWAPHAPAVFRAADEGSALAAAVVDAGAEHLARLVDQLLARGAVGRHVVAGGSVVAAQPRLEAGLRDRLASRHPELELVILREPPVAGALALARRLAGDV